MIVEGTVRLALRGVASSVRPKVPLLVPGLYSRQAPGFTRDRSAHARPADEAMRMTAR